MNNFNIKQYLPRVSSQLLEELEATEEDNRSCWMMLRYLMEEDGRELPQDWINRDEAQTSWEYPTPSSEPEDRFLILYSTNIDWLSPFHIIIATIDVVCINLRIFWFFTLALFTLLQLVSWWRWLDLGSVSAGFRQHELWYSCLDSTVIQAVSTSHTISHPHGWAQLFLVGQRQHWSWSRICSWKPSQREHWLLFKTVSQEV